MHILLTRPPKLFFHGYAKFYLKSLIKGLIRSKRGPDGVLNSLRKGLDQIGFQYALNIKPNKNDTVHVLSNIAALRYAIKLKASGNISKLIAGPNLVIIPTDAGNILSDKNIDAILINSQWTKDFYSSLLTDVEDKIYIWPAGVDIPNIADKKKDNVIVFKKSVPQDIFEKVITILREKNISHTVLEYGKFKQEDYFNLLAQSSSMIYLQEVESQGIALQEAWIRNIPTLVWNKGSYEYPTGHIVTGNISAPFLTPEAGMFFQGVDDFESQITAFISNLSNFTPRQYCEQNLSNKASALTYVKIVESIK